MSSSERAFQQLDPLGALTGRPITIAAAIGIPLFATVMTWLNRFDVDNWGLAIGALAAIVAACVVLGLASNPLRAPFTLLMHTVVSGLATLAYLLSVASMWEGNQFIRDDWGPMAIGLVMLPLSQYRPPKEVASTGITLALLVGMVALLQAPSLSTGTTPINYAVVAMTPLLALSLASAAFGLSLIDGIEGWRRRAARAATQFTDENTDWIARSVQQDRVTILNQDVVPFFAEVLQGGEIDPEHRERARAISDSIRAVMVAEADRSWLDIIVDQCAGEQATVDDPQRLSSAMSLDQRTAVRAVIVALSGHPAFGAQGFSIELVADQHLCRAVLRARMNIAESVVRSEFAPYLAVMRIVFSELRVELADSALTLRFSYDHR